MASISFAHKSEVRWFVLVLQRANCVLCFLGVLFGVIPYNAQGLLLSLHAEALHMVGT